MIVLPCNQPTYFDVDETLVMWNVVSSDHPDAIKITCPISRYTLAAQQIMQDSGLSTDIEPDEVYQAGEWTEYLKPHKKHIEQMKLHKMRGHTIIVWSAGGWEWALAVVKALKLEQYVDLVIEKPMWYYDDIPANEFMYKRSYLKDE